MTAPSRQQTTKARLLAAAASCFAEQGFRGTTIPQIAERAGVNLAAGHYHYGSKRDLYLEVLRAEFAAVRAAIARGHATASPAALRHMRREDLMALLRLRAKVMLEVLIGPPPGLHGTLILREMCDPSEALPVIVDEFIRPMKDELQQIVVHIEPTLAARAAERCTMSIIGQAVFYRFAMPAVLRLQELEAYPASLTAQLAEHITAFSLGGLRRVAAGRGRHAR